MHSGKNSPKEYLNFESLPSPSTEVKEIVPLDQMVNGDWLIFEEPQSSVKWAIHKANESGFK